MTQNNSPTSDTIINYRRFVANTLDDLSDAISDLSFQHQGGRIIRASDFTEIQAYVLPEEEPKSSSSPEGGNPFEPLALSLVTLNSFFFGQPDGFTESIVLLPPHRLELRRAESFFQNRSLLKFRDITQKAVEQLHNLHLDNHFRVLINKLDKSSSEADKNVIQDNIINYVNNHASELFLALTNQEQLSAHARLNFLLRRAKLADISQEDIIGRPITLDELDRVHVRRLTNLIYQRRSSRSRAAAVAADLENYSDKDTEKDIERIQRTSHSDALALTYVIKANDILSSSTHLNKRRLVLYTRSSIIVSCLKEYSEVTGNYLISHYARRITAFQASLLSSGNSPTDRLSELQQRKKSLELALRALPHSPTESEADDGVALRAHIERLRELWREASNLTVAASDWNIEDRVKKDRISEYITILRDKHRFNERLKEVSVQLAADITLGSAMLAVLAPVDDDTGDVETFVDKSRVNGGKNEKIFIWSKDTISTIGLYFYSGAAIAERQDSRDGTRVLQKLLALKQGNMLFSPSEVDRRVGSVRGGVGLVETCLACSFLEALADRWDLAETYSSLAINWPSQLDRTPKHEAFYMRALSRRRAYDPTEAILIDGLSDIKKAAESWRTETGSDDDPRFVLQEGVYYFSLWEHVDIARLELINAMENDGGQTPEQHHTDNLRRALLLFDRAWSLLEAKPSQSASINRLRLDVANARCYAYISAYPPDDRSLRLFVELNDAVRACGWADGSIPLSQQDTLVWTMFKLREKLQDESRILAAAQLLAHRLPHFARPNKDKNVIRGHLLKIGKYFGANLQL